MSFSNACKSLAMLLAGACSVVLAQSTQPARPELRFDKGEAVNAVESDLPKTVTWSCDATIRSRACIQIADAHVLLCYLHAHADALGFSPEQRLLMEDWPAVGIMTLSSDPLDKAAETKPTSRPVIVGPARPAALEYGLFAVSEADARRMVKGLVECINDQNRESYLDCQNTMTNLEQKIAEDSALIQEARKDRDAVNEQVKRLEEIVPVKDYDEAVKDQIELQKLLRSITIDIEGLRAKTEAIAKLRKSPPSGQGAFLDQLQIPLDIELAGAMARHRSVDTHLQSTTDYVKAMSKRFDLTADIRRREEQLAQAKPRLAQQQERMKEIEAILAEPLLAGPIVLRPVRVRSEQPQMPPSYEGPPLPGQLPGGGYPGMPLGGGPMPAYGGGMYAPGYGPMPGGRAPAPGGPMPGYGPMPGRGPSSRPTTR